MLAGLFHFRLSFPRVNQFTNRTHICCKIPPKLEKSSLFETTVKLACTAHRISITRTGATASAAAVGATSTAQLRVYPLHFLHNNSDYRRITCSVSTGYRCRTNTRTALEVSWYPAATDLNVQIIRFLSDRPADHDWLLAASSDRIFKPLTLARHPNYYPQSGFSPRKQKQDLLVDVTTHLRTHLIWFGSSSVWKFWTRANGGIFRGGFSQDPRHDPVEEAQ